MKKKSRSKSDSILHIFTATQFFTPKNFDTFKFNSSVVWVLTDYFEYVDLEYAHH